MAVDITFSIPNWAAIKLGEIFGVTTPEELEIVVRRRLKRHLRDVLFEEIQERKEAEALQERQDVTDQFGEING